MEPLPQTEESTGVRSEIEGQGPLMITVLSDVHAMPQASAKKRELIQNLHPVVQPVQDDPGICVHVRLIQVQNRQKVSSGCL